uniref:Uncharacterized protein n=1 Tax=Arundo donax TaxID=35708 RepID=A0A0A8ZXI7_ARUDO
MGREIISNSQNSKFEYFDQYFLTQVTC